MNNRPDLAVVIGTRFDKNWQLRQDLKQLLDETYKLYKKGEIKKIMVCGKWTIWYDWLYIVPPTTEAQLMKDYLVKKGVSPADIIKETRSKDTIGNLYYLKLFLDCNLGYRNILIICSTQRLERIKFLAGKILGDKLRVSYFTVDAPGDAASSLGSEASIRQAQESFLSDVSNGSVDGLRHKLYKLVTTPTKQEKSGRESVQIY